MRFKALIVDDEKEVAKALKLLLEKTCDVIGEITVSHSIAEALKICKNSSPDILFLDIEMPGGTGFDLLDLMQAKNSYIIFSTAHSQYAIKAIKAGAKDYLLKPVDPDELLVAVQKAKKYFEKEKAPKNNAKAASTISVPVASGIKFLNLEDVLYIKADGRYSEIFCKDKQHFLVCKNIGEYEKELSSNYFYRVHKSFLINCNHVSGINSVDGGFVEMTNKIQIEISIRKKAEFLKYLR